MTPPIRDADDFLVFGQPRIEQDEIDEVVDSLESGWLGTGPKVDRFEDAFEGYKGADHAVAVSSCTAALHLSLVAAGIGPGDEVVTTPMTFCATANVVLHVGATPVLADVDPETMNVDPDRVQEAITDDTAAILPVHFAGRPCDMDALTDLAEDHGLTLVEDAAHAVEAEADAGPTGTLGRFGCFSFYATKNLTTGEGGMVLCRDGDDAERIRRLALHGMSRDAWDRFGEEGYRHYAVVEPGYKSNMMDLQAAIGIHQLARLDAYWKRRRTVWDRYQDELADLPVERPADPEPGTRHGHHLYTALVDEDAAGVSRDDVLDGMTRENVGVGVHYVSLPEHPWYRDELGWDPDDWPHARDIGRRTVSLPLSARLSDADVDDVVAALTKVLGA